MYVVPDDNEGELYPDMLENKEYVRDEKRQGVVELGGRESRKVGKAKVMKKKDGVKEKQSKCWRQCNHRHCTRLWNVTAFAQVEVFRRGVFCLCILRWTI